MTDPAFYAYSTKIMVDQVAQRFDLRPRRLVGDTAYGTGLMLGWVIQEKGIEPHVPVWDKTERKDGTFSSSDFAWGEQANEYRCPQGHALRSDRRVFKNSRTRITKADTVIYRSSQSDCTTYTQKDQCCPNTPTRKIARSIREAERNVAWAIAATPEYQQSRCDRTEFTSNG